MNDRTTFPETREWLGVTYTTILSATASNGAMSIVDSVSPPGSGPPRHVHAVEDETFVVLSGDIEVWLEGETFVLGPGQSAMIPRGKEHTFKVLGHLPCRKLVILTPGGFDGFFAEMAAGRFRIPEDMPAIEEAAARFNLTFTGPPL